MAKEIERKFLVRTDGWRAKAVSKAILKQAYVASMDDRSVRVRVLDGESARLTMKIGRSSMTRDEFEYDIPVADAEELMESAIGIVIGYLIAAVINPIVLIIGTIFYFDLRIRNEGYDIQALATDMTPNPA